MSMFELYLLTRLDLIGITAVVTAVISTVIILLFSAVASDSDTWSSFGPLFKKLVWVPMVSWLIFIATPTNKDLAIIFAGHWATNSEEVKALPDNVVGVVNKFMNEYLKEEKK